MCYGYFLVLYVMLSLHYNHKITTRLNSCSSLIIKLSFFVVSISAGIPRQVLDNSDETAAWKSVFVTSQDRDHIIELHPEYPFPSLRSKLLIMPTESTNFQGARQFVVWYLKNLEARQGLHIFIVLLPLCETAPNIT